MGSLKHELHPFSLSPLKFDPPPPQQSIKDDEYSHGGYGIYGCKEIRNMAGSFSFIIAPMHPVSRNEANTANLNLAPSESNNI